MSKKVRQVADKRRGFTDIAAYMFKKVEVMKMELDKPHLKKTDWKRCQSVAFMESAGFT